MAEYTVDDQWRSFQTYIAAYAAGMLHPQDVFAISRAGDVAPPLVELRCDHVGGLSLSIGANAWHDEDGTAVRADRSNASAVAAELVRVLRDLEDVDDPSALRVSANGPASTISVLAVGGFASGEHLEPLREAVLYARMDAEIDVDGDAIEAAAQAVGNRVYESTKSGCIAAMACAAELARRRTWVDPFSPAPRTGYLVGGGSPEGASDGE